MENHKILIESGFGNYLIGKKPKAIANAFLYYDPSLLLWVDEIICDKYALEGEKNWAEKGYLVSELSIRLKNEGILKGKKFEQLFQDQIKNLLRESSEKDFQIAKKQNLAPTSTIDPENIENFGYNGFYDINAMLYLSQVHGTPYLDVQETNSYYEWKVRKLADITSVKEKEIFSQVLNIYVPSFELFPKNKKFFDAENSTKNLYSLFKKCCDGRIDLGTYKKAYSNFLDKWSRYDDSVRNQVLENFEVLIDLRKDKRLKALRVFISNLSQKITGYPIDKNFHKTLNFRLKKEFLEVLEMEREIAKEFKIFNFLDKCESRISFPIEMLIIMAGGATASIITQNPFFAALSTTLSGVKWIANILENKKRRNIAWYYYLLDFKNKVDRRNAIRSIEKEIRKIEKSGE